MTGKFFHSMSGLREENEGCDRRREIRSGLWCAHPSPARSRGSGDREHMSTESKERKTPLGTRLSKDGNRVNYEGCGIPNSICLGSDHGASDSNQAVALYQLDHFGLP